MIPLIGVVSVRRWPRSRTFRLWVPLFLLWLLMLPLMLLLLPVMFIVCLISRVNPFEAAATIWAIFAGFRDTHIEIDNGEALVLVHIL